MVKGPFPSFLALCLSFHLCFCALDWSPVDQVLEDAIASKAFPGCVALVGTEQGVVYAKAHGSFTYGITPPNNPDNPPMTLGTIFDMASCTKVTATTSAIAQFYQRGELNLHTKVVDILGQEFGQNGKEPITILNLLLHNSGYPPDPSPNYYEKQFGCPGSFNYYPPEDFSCSSRMYAGLFEQTLQNPIGTIYVYSDLNFITLAHVVGTLAQQLNYVTKADLLDVCLNYADVATAQLCYYEAYVRKHVFNLLGMKHTQFRLPTNLWPNAAPTLNDTTYRHRTMQGQVHDGNSYVSGGIAGHAGLFSTVHDLGHFMHRLMFAGPFDNFLNITTVRYFIREYNHSQSSRALGWNTNDPTVYDYGWNLSCGNMSSRTFTHTGYTGTQLCGDPLKNIYTVFLTNRVYPFDTDIQIRHVRKLFNSAVVGVLENQKKTQPEKDAKVKIVEQG